MPVSVDVQVLLDSFVSIAAERDENAVLERVVDLARLSTRARYGAALLTDGQRITQLVHAGMTTSQVAVLAHLPRGHGVLGAVLDEGRAIRLDRMQDHPSSVGFPLGHVPMSAFLGVPIHVDGALLGAIYLTKPPGEGAFGATDEVFVSALAGQAGHAVTMVRALAQSEDLAHRLGVAERLKSQAMAGLSNELDPTAAIDRILAAAQSTLGMELAFITRMDGDTQHLVQLSEEENAFGWSRGLALPVQTGYCHYVVNGQMPGLIPDAAREPIAAGLEITAQAGLGAYVGVPLELPGGRLYGTLCAVSQHARPELGAVDRELLKVLAALVADQLARLDAQEAARSAAVAELWAFLALGAITVVTQPIVDLRDGSVVGLEALARFPDHPEGPAAVFAAAAALDAGVDLELAAVRAALELLPDVPSPLYLSVNASPATVLDPRLSALLGDVEADRVVLELTEHVAVGDYAALVDALRGLRATGIRVAVDDAGSGFASLAHILSLAPDMIKLDIALTRGVDTDPARRALASALAGFAADLGATLVAEGIETHAELTALQDLGVAFGQGYHLGRPAALGAHDLTRDRYTGSERRRRDRPWWTGPAAPQHSVTGTMRAVK